MDICTKLRPHKGRYLFCLCLISYLYGFRNTNGHKWPRNNQKIPRLLFLAQFFRCACLALAARLTLFTLHMVLFSSMIYVCSKCPETRVDTNPTLFNVILVSKCPRNKTEVFGHWLKKTELWCIRIIWFHLWIVRRICKNISRSTYHHIVVYFNEASYLLSCFVFKANALRSRSAFQWGMLMLPKQKFEDWLNQTELWYFVFIRGSYE